MGSMILESQCYTIHHVLVSIYLSVISTLIIVGLIIYFKFRHLLSQNQFGGNEEKMMGVLSSLMQGVAPGGGKKQGQKAVRDALGGLGGMVSNSNKNKNK